MRQMDLSLNPSSATFSLGQVFLPSLLLGLHIYEMRRNNLAGTASWYCVFIMLQALG